MDLTQKPFACTINGCEMTFINEDHLNWHQKKHAMMLNLGLANKNSEIADQTPTPTRFIRNCEEVGLFQDLQNVNPFDETFKKAVELAKNGTLPVPQQTNTDDTLHTPHIFPPVESNQEKFPNRNENPSNEFCFVSVPTIQLTDEDDFDDCDLTIVTSGSDNEIENNSTKSTPPQLKRKIKDLPQNKNKSNKPIEQPKENPQLKELLKPNQNNVQKNSNKPTEQPKKNPQLKELLKPNQNNVQKNSDNAKEKERRRRNVDEKEKLREMNRAAQSRCRRKKQLQKRQMEDELIHLKGDNANLTLENQIFKHKFVALKELVTKARSNTNIKYSDFLNELEVIVNSTVALQNNAPKTREIYKNPSVVPVVQQPVATNPVLIQVLGSVDKLAVSVVPK